MEKGTYALDENSLRAAHSLFTGSGPESQEFLLFVTALEDFSVKAVNYRTLRFFKNVLEPQPVTGRLHENIMHPEDYPLFILFLNSCEDLEPSEEREILLRLKSPFGYWKRFIFKNRLYEGFSGDEKYILSFAKEVDPYSNGFKKNVTTNLETEKSLNESLNRYRVLINSLDKGFSIIELLFNLEKKPIDYLHVEINPAFEKHMRLKDPLGKTMKELSRDHAGHWFETYGKVVNTGETIRFEDYAHDLKSWFDIYAFPIGNKRYRRVAILFSDITARKTAEQKLTKLNEELEYKVKKRTSELKENNSLLQMVFDTVNQGIFILKPQFGENFDIVDFTYVRVNKKVKRYYKQKKMVGRSFLQLNPDAARSGVFETFKQAMLTGEGKDFEYYFEGNGRKNWFRVSTRRQKGLLVNSLENITRNKQKAKELKENIRFKKNLINTSPDIIMIFNLYDENVRYINRDLSPDEGLDIKKVTGMPLLDIIPQIHPGDRQKALEFFTNLTKASDEDIEEIEFRLRGKDRNWECFNARGKVFMRNKKGNAYEFIILLRNVQEQKRTQQALIHAEKLSIKGEIARMLGHELRNPLASIGMSADILDKKIEGPVKKELQNYVDIIRRSTTRLNNLVTDLLTSSNYSPPKLEKCCLAKATNKALAHAKDRIYLTGIQVVKKYRGPYYVSADEEKLKIAFLNIIVNASEAMVPDQGVLSISISKKGKDFFLTIADNGCGMEEEQLNRLFESFYTQKSNGLGIGLSSVKNILDDHGATIKVKSKPNKGTTFILTFPCYEKLKAN